MSTNTIPKGYIIIDTFHEGIILNDREGRFVSFSWEEMEVLMPAIQEHIDEMKKSQPNDPI